MNVVKELFPWSLCSYKKVCFLQYWQFSNLSASKHICGSLGETFSSWAGLRTCSVQSRSLPLPTWAVGTLLLPCMSCPSLQTDVQVENTQIFVGKAQSPLPLHFLKWFNLTQPAIARGISQPSPLLPSCSLLAQLSVYRLKHSKLWNIKSFKNLLQNGL